jgi:YD repeat-containing protein
MSRPARSFCFFFSLLGFFVAPLHADEPPPESESLMPDFYSDPSISTSKGYLGGAGSVTVDPFSGMASISTTDIVIPGNGGMDIVLTRSYNAPDPMASPDHSPVGLGWSLHFGYMEMAQPLKMCSNLYNAHTMDNPVFIRSDGASQLLALAYQYPAGGVVPTYVSADYSVLICPPESRFYLMDAAGNRYDFGEPTAGRAGSTRWVVERVTDRNGNKLDIGYIASGIWGSNGVVISSITASDGRTVNFKYTGVGTSAPQLSEIVVDQGTTKMRSWLFTYAAGDHPANRDIPYLKSVTNPESLLWQYNYWPYGKDQPGAMSIREVINPHGGREELLYDLLQFDNTKVDYSKTSLVVKHTKVASPLDIQEWVYGYSPSNTGDVTTVTGPDGVREFHHFGLMEAAGNSAWRIGTLKKIIFRPMDGATRTETFEWEPNLLSTEDYRRPRDYMLDYDSPVDQNYMVPRLKSKIVEIDNARYETHYLQYRFADSATAPVPLRVMEVTSSSGFYGARELHYGYASRPNKWLWSMKQSESNADGHDVVHRYWDYDANGNLIFDYDRGTEKHFSYDEHGNLAESRTGENRATSHENYFRGLAARVTFPDGGMVRREINSQGLITRETNQLGHVTTYSYDKIGRIIAINPPLGASTNISWMPTSMTVSRGGYTAKTDFDGFGREKEVRHSGEPGLSIRLRSKHDYAGRVVEQTISHDEGAVSHTANYGYDSHGRLRSVSHPGGSRSYAYQGSRINMIDEQGNRRETDHQSYGDISYGWPTRIVQDDSDPISIYRNQLGQITKVNQGGIDRIYSYNAIHALDSISEPETGIEQYRYDRSGNVVLTTKTDSLTAPTFQNWILTEWDDLNRPTTVLDGRAWIDQSPFPGTYVQIAWTENYQYDLAGQVTSKSRNEDKKAYSTGSGDSGEPLFQWSDATRWTQTYNEVGQLKTANLSVGKHKFDLSYNYDERGSLSSMQYPSGETLQFLPNVYGWPTRVGRYVDSVSYHPTGQPQTIQYSNGDVYQSELNNRLALHRYSVNGAGNQIIDRTLSYQGNGNIEAIADGVRPSYSMLMTYDGSGRLTQATGGWGVDVMNYDGIGNILSYARDGVAATYHYDTNNKLGSVSGRIVRDYGYDNTGSVNAADGATFLRNVDNKVWSHTSAAGSRTRMLYDTNGWRVSATSPERKDFYVYDAGGTLLHHFDEMRDKYTEYYRLSGTLVARRDLQIECEDDIDGDGIPHCVEKAWGLDPYDPQDAEWDMDNDGLTNLQEYLAGTDPNNKDTDGDGMPDGYEVANGLDPLVNDRNLDADGDGYSNWTEYLNGTDPQQPDPPLPVQTISAISGDGSAYVSWRASSLAGAYKVYVSEGAVFEPQAATVYDVSKTNFHGSQLQNGAVYQVAVTSVNSFGESAFSPVRTVRPSQQSWKLVNGEFFDSQGNVYDLNTTSREIWMNVFSQGEQGSVRTDVIKLTSGTLSLENFMVGGGGHAVVLWRENDSNTRLYASVYSPETRSWSSKITLSSGATVRGAVIQINDHGDILVGYVKYSQVWGPDGVSRNVFVPYSAFKSATSSPWSTSRIDGGLAAAHTPFSNDLAISLTESGEMLAAWQMTQWIAGESTMNMPQMVFANRGTRGAWPSAPDVLMEADYVSSIHASLGDDVALVTLNEGYDRPELFVVQSAGQWSAPIGRQGVRLGFGGGLISATKAKRSIMAGNAVVTSPTAWTDAKIGGSKSAVIGSLGASRYSVSRLFWLDDAGLARQSYFDGVRWQDEMPAGVSPVTSMSQGRMDALGNMVITLNGGVAGYMAHQNNRYAPVVSAQADYTTMSEGGGVSLFAYTADAENDGIISYQWSQVSGPEAQILTATAATTGIILPQVEQQEVAIFRLLAVDAGGSASESTIEIVITDLGPQPYVDAGEDQTVDEGITVVLQGTASGEEGDLLQYEWIQRSGPTVTMTGKYKQQMSFVSPDVSGTQDLQFELRVRVYGGNSNKDSVTVTVRDLAPPDTEPPTVSHSLTSWKVKGKTYYEFQALANEPAQILFRYTEGLILEASVQSSATYPGWHVYDGLAKFRAGSGSKVIEYFAVDPSGNASAIQSTGEL